MSMAAVSLAGILNLSARHIAVARSACTMTTKIHSPVLFIGGSGRIGAAAVKALRRLQPDLPITIGARDMAKASALASEVGKSDATTIDLDRSDLGLPTDATYSAIAMLLKDRSGHVLKYALARSLPNIASFSDFLTEIGPTVALHIQRPTSAATMLFGHFLGGTLTLATLHFAKEFQRVDAIKISDLIDEEYLGGPARPSANASAKKKAPFHLIRKDGKWAWVNGEDAKFSFRSVDGTEVQGEAITLPDLVSLAAETNAASIRIGYAIGKTATSRRGEGPSHEAIIEIRGERNDGSKGSWRYELVDCEGYSAMSGWGAALVVERLLGLAGGPPVVPGLYHPESIIDTAYAVDRIQAFGTRIHRS